MRYVDLYYSLIAKCSDRRLGIHAASVFTHVIVIRVVRYDRRPAHRESYAGDTT